MTNDKGRIINNIYYMLTYAFQVLHQSNYDDVATEEFENAQNLFAAILSKGIAQQLKQGLHKDYISRREDLFVMRGKLDINGTIKQYSLNKRELTCDVDELSENNIFNQIIKVTANLLLQDSSVEDEYKLALKKEMLFFSDVNEIDPLSIRWNAFRFNRNNQSYRMLLAICQLVIEGLLLSTDKGNIRLAQFLDEQRMCRLYEKFILEFYKKEIPTLKTTASQIEWQLDDEKNELLPSMQSDVMLTDGDKTLIIDAKYYSHATQVQFGKHTLHSQNIYQIFTYVMNHDVGNTGNVAGMLLYAKTEDEIVPDMEQSIMGHKITARTLDLNCDFKELSQQLKDIADNYFDI